LAEPSQAKPSQAKPSQAKPSQAKPSQAKPSQAKPSQAHTLFNVVTVQLTAEAKDIDVTACNMQHGIQHVGCSMPHWTHWNVRTPSLCPPERTILVAPFVSRSFSAIVPARVQNACNML
jgi:hypothetical protein